METQLMIQSTPNPNALKFVLNMPVKSNGNYTYTSASECENNPLAKAIFDLSASIKEVYFFDNYITVTQDNAADWGETKKNIQSTILEKIQSHDPDFKVPEPQKATLTTAQSNPELEKIENILDQTIRQALQMDGGDVQVISYEDNQLQILYQGACGSCPSATTGTLAAIESILRDQFNPEITVALAEML